MTGSVLTRPGSLRTLMRTAAAAIVVVLTTAMIGPFGGEQLEVNVWDKAMHFAAFGLMLWSAAVWFPRLPRLWTAALTLAFGGLIEIVQGQVGRDASWGDWLADGLGILAALAAWVVWRRFRERRARQTSNTR